MVSSIKYLIKTRKKLYFISIWACCFKECEIFSRIKFVLFTTLICLKPLKPSLKYLKIFSVNLFDSNPKFAIF